jgi:hypothetical protein
MAVTAEAIVDLIRAEHRSRIGGFAISTAEAMELIEKYAACAASLAVVEATKEAGDRTLAVFDEVIKRQKAV